MESDEMQVVVLAVDDSKTDRTILRHHLERIPGWRVELHMFSEPAAALAEFSPDTFDVVLLDYHLGPCTGVELHHDLKKAGNTAPVILMTGQGHEALAIEAMRAGISDYLPKASLSDIRSE